MTDWPAAHVIMAGDFNAHLFNDVACISPFDLAFRAIDQELRDDGFSRFPQVRTELRALTWGLVFMS